MSQLILGVLLLALPSWGDVKESDLWRSDGSAKVLWKDMSEEQKAYVLERKRARAEQVISNKGRSSKTRDVVQAYRDLNDLDAAATLAKEDYEANPESEHGTYKLRSLIELLSNAGRHKEALELYQKYLEEALPSYTKEELAKKKSIPNNPTYNEAMRFGDELRRRASDPGESGPEPEMAIKMHRAFHGNIRTERLKAVDFYSLHRARFMLEKAAAESDPEIKKRAQDHLNQLQQER